MSDNEVIKTYVWHEGVCFFVSTIERDSSSPEGGRFNETMVWEYDFERKERSPLISWQDWAFKGSIATHQRVVEKLFDSGLKGLEELNLE